MFVKICGLTTREAVAAAARAGADAVGFVFAESPRRVTPEQAAELCADLARSVIRVAVLRHPSRELWQHVLHVFGPDWLQTDAEDLERLTRPRGCAALPVYRNGRVPREDTLPARLLFEGDVSGSGRKADWQEASRLAVGRELVLAGGLDEATVAEAVRVVRPWGVDVSSGVEREPGRKDVAMIERFIARVRAIGVTP